MLSFALWKLYNKFEMQKKSYEINAAGHVFKYFPSAVKTGDL